MDNKNFLYIFLRGLFRIMFKIIYPIKINGINNLPKSGPAILCSNHISLLDPILLGCLSEPHVTFMAKKELFQIPLIGRVISALNALPVNREQVDRNAIKTSLSRLKNGDVFGIFPEGTRHGDEKQPLKGTGFLAAKSKAPVYPISIIGPYRIFRPTHIIIHPPVVFEKTDYDNDDDPSLAFSKHIMSIIYSKISDN